MSSHTAAIALDAHPQRLSTHAQAGERSASAPRRWAAWLVTIAAMSMTSAAHANGAIPPSPTVRAFGDNQAWVVTEDMVYFIGTTGVTITVPKGFITDFASIPQPLWSLGLSPHGQYSRAAVVHDYLYWTQACSRDQADRLLVVAMKESSVGMFDETAIYTAVSKFGWKAWRSNQQERKKRLPKVLPENYLRPSDPNMGWPEYRATLARQGVQDPQFDRKPPYCVYGNSTQVPLAASALPKGMQQTALGK